MLDQFEDEKILSKLSKKQLIHIIMSGCTSTQSLINNVSHQRQSKSRCFECEQILKDLGIRIPPMK